MACPQPCGNSQLVCEHRIVSPPYNQPSPNPLRQRLSTLRIFTLKYIAPRSPMPIRPNHSITVPRVGCLRNEIKVEIGHSTAGDWKCRQSWCLALGLTHLGQAHPGFHKRRTLTATRLSPRRSDSQFSIGSTIKILNRSIRYSRALTSRSPSYFPSIKNRKRSNVTTSFRIPSVGQLD